MTKEGKSNYKKGDKKRELPHESGTCTEKKNPPQKRNRKEVAMFGNYRNYYGYRIEQGLDEDPRLKVMKIEWFKEKDCLDIGCNSGLITISIAQRFCCRSILGIDIDGARVEDAKWTLRKVVKTSTSRATSKTQTVDAELVNGSDNCAAAQPVTNVARENSGESSLQEAKDLFKVVSFEKGNFVQNWSAPANKSYHAILCLSVSKWVHLNWGDDGIVTLFSRVWALLEPGGVFVLEPQPWSSYYNNRLVSETTATNYKSIQISPEDFQDLLLDKIGFRRVENLTSSLSGTKAGFNRPILAFWK